MFDIIIPYFNGDAYISKLVDSIPSSYQIIIVDDLSDKPLELERGNVSVIRLSQKGYFTGAVNFGIAHSTRDVLILNQDTHFVGTGWLELIEAELQKDVALFGERIQGERSDGFTYAHGTFYYITRTLIDEIGLLNEKLYPLWGSNAEYQVRASRAGFRVHPIHAIPDFKHARPKHHDYGSSIKTILAREPNKKRDLVKTPPLVSVIIPVHNFSSWLKSTVNSLIGGDTDLGRKPQQTFASFEVIIVDDSSTDDTPKVVSELSDKWKRVRTLRLDRDRQYVWCDQHDKYIGKPVALNEGIAIANGKYILPLDADDMMSQDRIEQMVNAIVKNPHSFIYDDAIVFTTNSTFKNGDTRLKWTLNEFDFDVCLRKNQAHNSIMFSKSAWSEIGGYNEVFKYGREDWAMNIQLAVHGYCGVHINYAGLLYRRDGQNRTLDNAKSNWMNYFQKQMFTEFRKIYEGDRPMACCGRGAKSVVSRTQSYAPRNTMEIGTEGTSLVSYIGRRSTAEAFTVYGFETGTQYRVTPGKPFRVDTRDLISKSRRIPGLLEMVEGNENMLVLVEDEIVPDPVDVPLPVPLVQAVQETDFSILDTGVTVLKNKLKHTELSEKEITALIAFEMSHKNRRGAITALESKRKDA